MLSIANYGVFVASAVALCLTPGIDTVYILTRTIAGGRREGLASALGINTGLLIHTVLVAAGLSLVLAASPVAFSIIKIAGAAYLAVMGVRNIVSSHGSFSVGSKTAANPGTSATAETGNGASSSSDVTTTGANSTESTTGAGTDMRALRTADAPRTSAHLIRRTYIQGVLTNVLNPKIILFFLALLPQFVVVPNEHGPLPFLILGCTYAALSTVWTVIIVLIAAPFARLLRRSERAARLTNIFSGVVYIILGAMILFSE